MKYLKFAAPLLLLFSTNLYAATLLSEDWEGAPWADGVILGGGTGGWTAAGGDPVSVSNNVGYFSDHGIKAGFLNSGAARNVHGGAITSGSVTASAEIRVLDGAVAFGVAQDADNYLQVNFRHHSVEFQKMDNGVFSQASQGFAFDALAWFRASLIYDLDNLTASVVVENLSESVEDDVLGISFTGAFSDVQAFAVNSTQVALATNFVANEAVMDGLDVTATSVPAPLSALIFTFGVLASLGYRSRR